MSSTTALSDDFSHLVLDDLNLSRHPVASTPPRRISVDHNKLTNVDHQALDEEVLEVFRYHLEFNKEPGVRGRPVNAPS
jgi:hypothetical protein